MSVIENKTLLAVFFKAKQTSNTQSSINMHTYNYKKIDQQRLATDHVATNVLHVYAAISD